MTFWIGLLRTINFCKGADREFDRFRCLLSLSRQNPPNVDQVIGDNSESDPSIHPVLAAIPTPIQPVSSFQNADPTFATGSPLLAFSEPTRLLSFTNKRILCRPVWY